MKTLSFDEMKRVSGAGHFGDVRDANMGKSGNDSNLLIVLVMTPTY